MSITLWSIKYVHHDPYISLRASIAMSIVSHSIEQMQSFETLKFFRSYWLQAVLIVNLLCY